MEWASPGLLPWNQHLGHRWGCSRHRPLFSLLVQKEPGRPPLNLWLTGAPRAPPYPAQSWFIDHNAWPGLAWAIQGIQPPTQKGSIPSGARSFYSPRPTSPGSPPARPLPCPSPCNRACAQSPLPTEKARQGPLPGPPRTRAQPLFGGGRIILILTLQAPQAVQTPSPERPLT